MGDATRHVFWDTETTGVAPEDGDRVVEIALVETDADLRRTGRTFHAYANPEGRPVGESFAVHGLSDEFLAGQPAFGAHAEEILAFVDGAVMVAHNSEFDERFLGGELARLGLAVTWGRCEDSLLVARRRFPGESVSLDSLVRRFGIDGSARVKHGALVDTELLVEVYAHLTGRTSLLGTEEAVASAAHAGDFMPDWARQSWFPARPIAGHADDDLAGHAALTASLKDAVWSRFWPYVPAEATVAAAG